MKKINKYIVISVSFHTCILCLVIFLSQREVINISSETIVYILQEDKTLSIKKNNDHRNINYTEFKYNELDFLPSSISKEYNLREENLKKKKDLVFYQKPRIKPKEKKETAKKLKNIIAINKSKNHYYNEVKYNNIYNLYNYTKNYTNYDQSDIYQFENFYNNKSKNNLIKLDDLNVLTKDSVIGNTNLQKNNPLKNKNNLSPYYPYFARVNGIEGVVLLEVVVSNMGNITNVLIKKTSGYRILDKAAYSAVKNWSFIPATRNGKNVNSKIDIPIRFSLKDS